MIGFQTASHLENGTIAVTGPCYLNHVAVQPSPSAEGWAQFRDTIDANNLDDNNIKTVVEAAADKTQHESFGEGNQGMYFAKGIHIRTGGARVYIGVTLVGDSTKRTAEDV